MCLLLCMESRRVRDANSYECRKEGRQGGGRNKVMVGKDNVPCHVDSYMRT